MADPAIALTPGEISAYYAARVPHLNQRRLGEWRCACPIHNGKNDSFAVEPATGQWFCHSTCGRGGDILELEKALTGGNFPNQKAKVFRIVGRIEPEYRHSTAPANGNSAGTAPAKPTKPAIGGNWREVARYPYMDQRGQLLFEVIRYLKPDATKPSVKYGRAELRRRAPRTPSGPAKLRPAVSLWGSMPASTFSILRRRAETENPPGGAWRTIRAMMAHSTASAIARVFRIVYRRSWTRKPFIFPKEKKTFTRWNRGDS